MKNVIAVLALTLSTMAFAGNAQDKADRLRNAVWTCALDFNLEAGGLQVILGSFKGEGFGKLNCMSILGEREQMDVKVSLKNKKLSPHLSIGRFQMRALSAKLGLLNENPEDLLGTYRIGAVQGALGFGAGALVATHIDFPGVALDLSFQITRGAGLNLGFSTMTIEAL